MNGTDIVIILVSIDNPFNVIHIHLYIYKTLKRFSDQVSNHLVGQIIN